MLNPNPNTYDNDFENYGIFNLSPLEQKKSVNYWKSLFHANFSLKEKLYKMLEKKISMISSFSKKIMK